MIEATNVGPITHPRRTLIDEDGNTFHVEYRGSLTSVTVTLANGLKAKGHARLYEGDVYNKEFGTTLAITRAMSRVLNKHVKWLARESNRLARQGFGE